MARISGVNIPTDKAVVVSLRYIYGIGSHISKKICIALNIDLNTRVKNLNGEDIIKIREYIDQNVSVEGDLRRVKTMAIKRLQDIACFRGVRHRLRLPCRGQRTHTNAKTRKRVS
ncbi:MAG: small subunit ribosomal protein S13 [Alphaproteobacteria bacterium]|jgi:small subunit ribosomal protein S13